VQGVVVPKLPAGLNATVPAGVDTVPPFVAGSTTVAVQVEDWATRTVEGVHDIVVVVARKLTFSVAELLPVPTALVAETVTRNAPERA
jgi:hypothetical protein